MTRLGKVHGNRMVDVNASANVKLRDRGIRLVSELGGVDRARAERLLDEADGRVKVAIVMAARDVDADAARRRLESARGLLADALS